jgi:hypothetical protein
MINRDEVIAALAAVLFTVFFVTLFIGALHLVAWVAVG